MLLNLKVATLILILHKQGLSNRKIAQSLNVSRNTVKKYLNSLNSEPSYKCRPLKSTKLGPYHHYLKQRVHAASPEWIPATVLFLELKRKGYSGGISQLREYLMRMK